MSYTTKKMGLMVNPIFLQYFLALDVNLIFAWLETCNWKSSLNGYWVSIDD